MHSFKRERRVLSGGDGVAKTGDEDELEGLRQVRCHVPGTRLISALLDFFEPRAPLTS